MKKIIILIVALTLLVAGIFARDDEIRRLPTENKGLMKPWLLDNYMPYIEGTQEAILEWVSDNIVYKEDMDTWGVGDYWQTPEETIVLRTGDCEDFTILAMALLYSIEVYSELVLLDVADGMNGKEWEDEPDRDIGGHAIIWIYDGYPHSHSRGYYEPQSGRKAIYQYIFNGHIDFYNTMDIAYNSKSLNPDKWRIPEILEE